MNNKNFHIYCSGYYGDEVYQLETIDEILDEIESSDGELAGFSVEFEQDEIRMNIDAVCRMDHNEVLGWIVTQRTKNEKEFALCFKCEHHHFEDLIFLGAPVEIHSGAVLSREEVLDVIHNVVDGTPNSSFEFRNRDEVIARLAKYKADGYIS